jgi:hypothetical protein
MVRQALYFFEISSSQSGWWIRAQLFVPRIRVETYSGLLRQK